MSYDRSNIITAPWGGWDESSPSLLLPPASFKRLQGFLFNKQRLQNFPNLPTFPTPPDGEVIQGGGTFSDTLGFLHSGVMTKDHVYYLNESGVYTLQGNTTAPSINTFETENFLNRLFYVNGAGSLNYLDGGQGINGAGDVPGTSFFIGKLAASLLLLNTVEAGVTAPLNVRWCAINNPLEWDSTVDPTAGVATIPEAEDQIYGFANQKGLGVIYRSQGITIMIPTGTNAPRFSFSNFSTGLSGIGCRYPYTLDSYGFMSMFVSEDDIYMMSSLSDPVPVAGKAKKQIFSDLSNATGNPWATFVGKLGPGIDYLSYWLNIPQGTSENYSSTWIYHLNSQTWVNEQLPYGAVRWMGNVAIA